MVMGQFCSRCVDDMSEESIRIYEQLLEEDDWDIWAWLNGRGQPPQSAYEPLLAQMREYVPLAKQQEMTCKKV